MKISERWIWGVELDMIFTVTIFGEVRHYRPGQLIRSDRWVMTPPTRYVAYEQRRINQEYFFCWAGKSHIRIFAYSDRWPATRLPDCGWGLRLRGIIYYLLLRYVQVSSFQKDTPSSFSPNFPPKSFVKFFLKVWWDSLTSSITTSIC